MSSRVSVHSRSVRLLGATVSVAALVALAVGCSDSKTESTTTAPGTTEAPTTAPNTGTTEPGGPTSSLPEGIETKLLTAEEVGSTWKLGPEVNEMDLTMNVEICPGVVLDAGRAKRLSGRVGVQFEPSDKSSRHLMEQFLIGDPAKLNSDLRVYFDTLTVCPVDPAGAEGTYLSLQPLDVPVLGDQSLGVAIKAQESASGPVWFVRQAVVRVGGTAVALGLTEILPSATAQPNISDNGFYAIVTKAFNKLSA